MTRRLSLRSLADERALLALFIVYLVACMAALLILRHAALDAVRGPALARVAAAAEAALSGRDPPTGVARWLHDGAVGDDQFENEARALREQPPGTRIGAVHAFSTIPFAEFAIHAPGGRILLVRQRFAADLIQRQTHFEQLYISFSVTGLVALLLLGLGATRARRRDSPPRKLETAASAHGAKSHLPVVWIVGLSFVIFAIDLAVPMGPAIGILYIVVVVAAQWSPNRRHAWLAVALGTTLAVAKVLIAERIPDMWPALANRTLAVFAVWTVAVLGQWQRRMQRLQGRALTEARESNAANVELKQMLKRVTAAESELRRHQQTLETVAGMTRTGSWEFDLASDKPLWSQEVFRIHELPPDKLPSFKDALNFYPPEAREQIQNSWDATVLEGKPFDHTVPFISATGRHLWVRVLGRAEMHDGRTVKLTGAIQDVTEQHETQARLARTTRGTQDGTWEQNIVSGRMWVSPRFCELADCDEKLLRSSDAFLTLLHPEDLPQFEAARSGHLNYGEPIDLELRLQRRDDSYRWFHIRGTLERDAQDNPVMLSGSIRDVSRQREAEDALIAAKDQAALAAAAKGEFLANMSHEIRTPMNGVLGMTELLLDTPLTTTQRQFSETIRSSATALLSILNDILDFSKIEAGKLEIERIPFDLRDCVESVAAMMALQASTKNIELIVGIDPSLPERVVGDPNRVRQLLVNLCGNALKFTRAGEVVIEVFPAAARTAHSLIHFEVRDTGIGMSAETVDRLFRPFMQADASITRRFGGTGLGLSIVHRLVELMGGTIHVESTPNEGSTFAFTLPLEASVEPDAATRDNSVGLAGKRVLIVEDNATTRRVLQGQLEFAGVEVAMSESVESALAKLDAHAASTPFDAVIADEELAAASKEHLCSLIKWPPRSSTARVILLTALDEMQNAAQLETLGCDGCLVKPVRGRELRETLLRVLGRDPTVLTGPLVTRAALSAEASEQVFARGVLLVEDNEVNQQVARRFLERLGCSVEVAGDGLAGIEAWRRGAFELILMDVHMPNMDGLTAAREIRKLERPGERIPIYALTASALTDEVQRCIAAGMDGMLSKPLEAGKLREVLERVSLGLATTDGQVDKPAREAVGSTCTTIDRSALEAVADGDKAFMTQLVGTFVDGSKSILKSLQEAVASRDRAAVVSLAHKLKGSSQSIGAHVVGSICLTLEREALQLDNASLRSKLGQLEQSLDICISELQDILRERPRDVA